MAFNMLKTMFSKLANQILANAHHTTLNILSTNKNKYLKLLAISFQKLSITSRVTIERGKKGW